MINWRLAVILGITGVIGAFLVFRSDAEISVMHQFQYQHCPDHCHHGAKVLLTHQQFLPRLEYRNAKEAKSGADSTIDVMSDQFGEVTGTDNIAAALERLSKNPGAMAIALDKRAHCHVILGTESVEIAGNSKTYLKIAHGLSTASFIAAEEFLLKFKDAKFYILESPIEAPEGQVHCFGSASLRIDRPFIDYGIVKPFAEQRSSIRITNVGESVVGLEKPLSSCSCTVTDIGINELPPGEAVEIEVKYTSRNKAADIQRILVPIRDYATQEFATVECNLAAWQLAYATWKPGSINFGLVDRDGKADVKSEIFVFERESDRFDNLTAHADSPHLSFSVSHVTLESGRRRYDVQVVLNTLEMSDSVQNATVTVSTNSSQVPVFRVPVKWKLRPRFELDPTVAVFDDKVKIDFEIHSHNDEQLSVDFLHVPSEVDVRIGDRQAGKISFAILQKSSRARHQTTEPVVLLLEVKSGEQWQQRVEIPCVLNKQGD
ncbi:MAG: DUF1573 domain-containing protein [Planctomycetales bacterium]|nr:DUF1573 domain-containing protein [Planctomycetales bacterium]